VADARQGKYLTQPPPHLWISAFPTQRLGLPLPQGQIGVIDAPPVVRFGTDQDASSGASHSDHLLRCPTRASAPQQNKMTRSDIEGGRREGKIVRVTQAIFGPPMPRRSIFDHLVIQVYTDHVAVCTCRYLLGYGARTTSDIEDVSGAQEIGPPV
jgi:hypothetical protein